MQKVYYISVVKESKFYQNSKNHKPGYEIVYKYDVIDNVDYCIPCEVLRYFGVMAHSKEDAIAKLLFNSIPKQVNFVG